MGFCTIKTSLEHNTEKVGKLYHFTIQAKFIFNKPQLESFIKKLDEFRQTQIDSADFFNKHPFAIKRIIEIAVNSYKFSQLQFILAGICAYLLYKKEYVLLKLFLTYNQPKDSEALWGNEEILPVNSADLVGLILSEDLIEQYCKLPQLLSHSKLEF